MLLFISNVFWFFDFMNFLIWYFLISCFLSWISAFFGFWIFLPAESGSLLPFLFLISHFCVDFASSVKNLLQYGLVAAPLLVFIFCYLFFDFASHLENSFSIWPRRALLLYFLIFNFLLFICIFAPRLGKSFAIWPHSSPPSLTPWKFDFVSWKFFCNMAS